MITLKDYLTASGRYPEREKHLEVTAEVIKNAEDLLRKVNAFLAELKIDKVKVSSGFRPSQVNAATPGAAKKSNHMRGLAIDLADPTGKLDILFLSNQPLLEKHGLYLEHPDSTLQWAHLQSVAPKSGKRVFKP